MTNHHIYHMTLLGFELESVRTESEHLVIILCPLHDAVEVSAKVTLGLSEVTVLMYLSLMGMLSSFVGTFDFKKECFL